MSKNPVIGLNGTKRWFNEEGQFHREDGPAVERADGEKSWWLNGKRHREDGPAIEHANGTKSWWLNDQLHRKDGPAVEYADGSKEWWLNNKELSEDLHKRLTGGPLDRLPLYLGQDFDEYISERLRDEESDKDDKKSCC